MDDYKPMDPNLTVSPIQAKALIAAGAILVDVRTPAERQYACILESINIPIAELGERIGELSKGKIIITHCHHGVRSLFAASMLRKRGIDAKSMDGGIERWSREVDAKVPEY